MRRSRHEATLAAQLEWLELPPPTPEYRFHRERRWRFDLAWPELMIAVEIHGAIWTRGRHLRGAGFRRDREKSRAAQRLGWRIYEYTPEDVQTLVAATELQAIVLQATRQLIERREADNASKLATIDS